MNIKKDSKHAGFFNNEGNQSQSLFGFRTPPVLGAANTFSCALHRFQIFLVVFK